LDIPIFLIKPKQEISPKLMKNLIIVPPIPGILPEYAKLQQFQISILGID